MKKEKKYKKNYILKKNNVNLKYMLDKNSGIFFSVYPSPFIQNFHELNGRAVFKEQSERI